MDERPDRVRRDPAEVAGVQVAVRAFGSQFEVGHAAHAELDCLATAVVDRPIAGHDQVDIEQIGMRAHEFGDVRRANLLLALEQDDHVAGERAIDCQQRLDRQQVGEVLPLVVAGAASVDPPIPDLRQERW